MESLVTGSHWGSFLYSEEISLYHSIQEILGQGIWKEILYCGEKHFILWRKWHYQWIEEPLTWWQRRYLNGWFRYVFYPQEWLSVTQTLELTCSHFFEEDVSQISLALTWWSHLCLFDYWVFEAEQVQFQWHEENGVWANFVCKY